MGNKDSVTLKVFDILKRYSSSSKEEQKILSKELEDLNKLDNSEISISQVTFGLHGNKKLSFC
ncbi:hypothetical protein AGMMS49938_09720 [Fibrobacterales bacterium]|nr:hypothetical protein AGMMS49938_09720 [Fibrobacterales bacterium]